MDFPGRPVPRARSTRPTPPTAPQAVARPGAGLLPDAAPPPPARARWPGHPSPPRPFLPIPRRPTPPRRQNPHPTPRPVPPQTNAAVSHQSTVTLTRRTTPQHDHGHQAQSTYHMNESRHATSRIITYRLQPEVSHGRGSAVGVGDGVVGVEGEGDGAVAARVGAIPVAPGEVLALCGGREACAGVAVHRDS